MEKVARAGFGVILLRDDEVLLGKRHDDPEKASSMLHGEGTWTLPGGKLDFGERLDEGAKREVYEETGIIVNSLEAVSITDEIVHDAHFVTIGFISKDFEGDAKVMEPDEITEWKWFSLDNLPKPMFPPSEKALRNFMEGKLYQ